MSLDERDYYYETKEFRKKPSRKPAGFLFYVVIWTIISFSIFSLFSEHYKKKLGIQPSSPMAAALAHCESLPPNGGVFVMEPSITRRSDVIYSGLKFDSALMMPTVLIISNPEMTVQYQSVAVHPGQSAQVNLPIGKYGLSLFTGMSWCNIRDGFTNGERITVSSPIEVKTGETATLKMSPTSAPSQLNLMVTYVSLAEQMAEKLPKQVFGNGYMDLRRDRSGHYRVPGGINGSYVEFMVDTGASLTSITNRAAIDARVPSCNPRIFNTAGGKVNGCVGVAQKLVFGNFTIEDVEVAIMPELEENLLGMNVLSRVRIEQQGDVMRMSAQ